MATELLLDMKLPVICGTITSDGREERVLNHEATFAAREKRKRILEFCDSRAPSGSCDFTTTSIPASRLLAP